MTAVAPSTITSITNPLSNPQLITNALLTTKIPDSTGIFDELMTSVKEHLETQYEQNRITGEEFGKLYVSAMSQAMQTAVSFLLAKETANLQNSLLKEQIYASQLDNARKIEEVLGQQKQNLLLDEQIDLLKSQDALVIAQTATQTAQTANVTKDTDLKTSQMSKITAEITSIGKEDNIKDKQVLLVAEQYEAERAKTKDTLSGTGNIAIAGLIKKEKEIKEAQILLIQEQYDSERSKTKNTLSDGTTSISGITQKEKELKEAQIVLIEEQTEAERSKTRDTLSNGTSITGLSKRDMDIKEAQILLVKEQYEAERAKTKNTLSTGGDINGTIKKDKDLKDAQIDVYEKQSASFVLEGKYKTVKLATDAHIAFKTQDEAVAPIPEFTNISVNSGMTELKAASGLSPSPPPAP